MQWVSLWGCRVWQCDRLTCHSSSVLLKTLPLKWTFPDISAVVSNTLFLLIYLEFWFLLIKGNSDPMVPVILSFRAINTCQVGSHSPYTEQSLFGITVSFRVSQQSILQYFIQSEFPVSQAHGERLLQPQSSFCFIDSYSHVKARQWMTAASSSVTCGWADLSESIVQSQFRLQVMANLPHPLGSWSNS